MNRPELLDFINLAIESGAKINIRFADLNDSKEKALTICRIFSDLTGEPVVEQRVGRNEQLSVTAGKIELVHRYSKKSSTIMY